MHETLNILVDFLPYLNSDQSNGSPMSSPSNAAGGSQSPSYASAVKAGTSDDDQ